MPHKLLLTSVLFLSTKMAASAGCTDLVRAYPDFLKGCSGNTLIWHDGTQMRYDDGRKKSFEQALTHPDLEDMFRYPYPRGAKGYNVTPRKNFDPGRIRYEAFFRKMYGNSASQVRRHLTTINWFGQRIRVTTVNGVARQLQAVKRDLEREVRRTPGLKKYLTPVGGTFTWRRIAGTDRLSVHSFGAAIDINVKYSAYWRWDKGPYRYRNQIPLVIVKAFERHGFIWGGKWYHYDTMHFEYRPELLLTRGSRGGGKSLAASPRPAPSTSHSSSGSDYTVTPGDTLWSIARRYRTDVKTLRRLNNLTDDKLQAGQILTLPQK